MAQFLVVSIDSIYQCFQIFNNVNTDEAGNFCEAAEERGISYQNWILITVSKDSSKDVTSDQKRHYHVAIPDGQGGQAGGVAR